MMIERYADAVIPLRRYKVVLVFWMPQPAHMIATKMQQHCCCILFLKASYTARTQKRQLSLSAVICAPSSFPVFAGSPLSITFAALF
jgi:hypothetical protein